MTDLSRIAYEAIRPAYAENCVRASFAPLKDLKITWIRTRTEIEFTISDYLDGAPEEVIGGLIRWTHRRISGNEDIRPGKQVSEYLLSAEFREKAFPAWLERHGADSKVYARECGLRVGTYPGETPVCSSLMNAVLIPESWPGRDPDRIKQEIRIARRYIRLGREGFAAGIRPDMDKIREEFGESAGIRTE